MFDLTTVGKWIAFAGLALCLLGGAVWLAGKFGLPLGRLPGDIRIEGDGYSFYFPIVTSIIASVLLTLLVNAIARLLK